MKEARAKMIEALKVARAEAKEIEQDLLNVERVLVYWQEGAAEPTPETVEGYRERLLEIQATVNRLTSRLAAIYFMGGRR